MFPPDATYAVSIYHLPATGTTEYPATANTTTQGALLPLDRYAHTLEGGQYQDPHELYVGDTVDIRVNDKVVIASRIFFVKHVFSAPFGRLRHKRATVSTER